MHVLILGTRGIPAKHGGFETFAHNLSLFLKSRNHDVTVYCQQEQGEKGGRDVWNGINRVLIPAGDDALGTIKFDWAATWHSAREKDAVILTLGYNTGVFSFLYRLNRVPSLMNMDGIEWKREKWSPMQRAWLWFNELAGARAANHLIADHPEIQNHLGRHTSADKITMIPYGADAVLSAPVAPIRQYGLEPKNYFILIARSEPENSVLEIVRAYSQRRRGMPLIALGTYKPETNLYHRKVMAAASSEVIFPGAIYDSETVKSLRFHAKAYFHGHRVGGTNPSLVESLAAGNAVIAHNNRFNRWVAGTGARFFNGADDLARILEELESSPELFLKMEEQSHIRHRQSFVHEDVLLAYEKLLLHYAEDRVRTSEQMLVAP